MDPISEFERLFAEAQRKEPHDATAMSLATTGKNGWPAVRMVLLKGVDGRGFVFYTNHGSRKARELAANPRAALCVYWPTIKKQIRIEGPVERVSDEEADEYFATRSRDSQMGAWASRQSEPLGSRAELLARFVKLQARFGIGEIPRPEFWGGYRLVPERIEIWHNQAHRLHDRFLWQHGEDGWQRTRLYP